MGIFQQSVYYNGVVSTRIIAK